MLEVYFVGLLGKYRKKGIYNISGIMAYNFNDYRFIPVVDSNVNEYAIKGINCETLGKIVDKVYTYDVMHGCLVNNYQGLSYRTSLLPVWDVDSLELITIDLVDKPLYMENSHKFMYINTHTLKMVKYNSPIVLFLNLDNNEFRICYYDIDINTLKILDAGFICDYDEDSTYLETLQTVNIQDFNSFNLVNNFCYTDTSRLSGNDIVLPSECETFLVNDSIILCKKASLVFPPKIKSIQLMDNCYKDMVLNTYYFSKHTDVKVIVDFGLKICRTIETGDEHLFYYYLLRNKTKDIPTIQKLVQYMRMLVNIKENNYNSTVDEVVNILKQLKLEIEVY